MKEVARRLEAVRGDVTQMARRHGRAEGSIRLLAVSKTKPASDVLAAVEAGQLHFGENHLQDALSKITAPALAGRDLCWHFIGPVQSNKTRPIAQHFHWVHSIDREKIARRLSEQRPAAMPPLNLCIQVNIDGEQSKAGVSPENLPALAAALMELPRIRLRGLMAIPRPEQGITAQRRPFARLRALQEHVNAHLDIELDTLSMGMSDDLEAAIAEGATWVRIGTAIFGARAPTPPAAPV